MNRYEQAFVSAVKQITKSDAAHAASDARWLLGMVMDAAPQVIGQSEYKMFTSLLSCNGNRILAEATRKPAAARDAEVERLVQRLQSDFLLDEASARRICALYLAGITGDESYIRALDSAGNKTNPAPQNAPKPKQRPQPQQRPAPSPATAQPTPAPKQSPAPAPVPWPQKTPQPAQNTPPAKKSSRLIGVLVSVVVVLIAAALGTSTGRALVGGLFGGDKLAGTTWRGELNITKEIAAELDETVAKEFADMDGISADSLPQFSDYCGAIKVVADLSFSDDGAISMTINETALRNTAREAIGEPTAQWMLDCLKAISREMGADLEEMGYSDDDILLMTVGMTKDELTDYVGDYMDEYVGDALKEAADDVTVSAYYKVRGGKIYILNTPNQSVSNSPYYTYTLKDSTLVLETAVGLDEGAENVYPLTLTKVG